MRRRRAPVMTERPYKLPEGWRWVRLGEVASEIQSGFAFRKKGAKDGDILHIRPYNISSDGELLLEQQFKIPTNALPEGWSYLLPGDVLFNNTNSVELLGKTVIVKTKMLAAFSNHITRIRICLDKCKGEWLALVLRTLWQQGFFAQHCNKWVGQAGYNTKMLKKTLIPLPPLNEQQRIVAKVEALLEQVREARILRQKACEDTDCLWQAVLADTFPRPGTDLPPNWRWVRLGEVCEVVMGQSPPSSTYNQNKVGLPFFQGKSDFGELYPSPRVWCSAPKKIAIAGDILISVRAPVGPTNLTNIKCCIGRGLAGIRVGSELDRYWLLFYLRSIENLLASSGTGSTFSAITKKELLSTLVPLPPLEEQRRIVTYLESTQEKINPLKDSQAQFETELQLLEQSILNSAFRREL